MVRSSQPAYRGTESSGDTPEGVAALNPAGEKGSYAAGRWFGLRCLGVNEHGVLEEVHVHIAVYSRCPSPVRVLETVPGIPRACAFPLVYIVVCRPQGSGGKAAVPQVRGVIGVRI